MVLNSLQLRNYKQYRHLDLEFKEGLVGIIGRNGAGKSTLFEAILYCFFGREEGNKTFVRSSFADAKANVSLALEFSIEEIRYRIVREFRGKILTSGAELYKNDQLIAKGVSPVNEELVKVLNMEREGFKRSVFSGQKELAELSELTGEARKKMVRRMLGLDTLDAVQLLVSADIRDMNSQITGQRQNLLEEEAIQRMTAEIEAHQVDLKTEETLRLEASQQLAETEAKRAQEKMRFDELEIRLKQFNALQNAIAQLQERMANLAQNKTTLEAKRREITELAEKIEREKPIFAQYEKDRIQVETLEASRQKQVNRKGYLTQIEALRAPMQELQKELSTLDAKLEKRAEVDALILSIQEKINRCKQQREDKRSEHGLLSNQISALQERLNQRQQQISQLQDIGAEGTCPTCFQPVKSAYDRVLEQLQQELNAMESREKADLEKQKQRIIDEGTAIKAAQEKWESELKSAEAERTLLEGMKNQRQAEARKLEKMQAQVIQFEAILKEIGEVEFDAAAFDALRASIQAREKAYQIYKNEENYVNREASQNLINLKRIETELETTVSELEQRKTEQTNLNYNPELYQAAKEAFTGYDSIWSAQNATLRTLENKVAAIQSTIQGLQIQLSNNERIKSQISAKLEEVEILDKLYKHLGQFKTDILDRVSPGISREASHLFSRITKGKYERIEVDENFEFAIADSGMLYPIQRFSGGEVDLANFCLRIAITKAIMEIGGGQQIEFLAFDEIFGSQDEERRLEIMLALHYLQEQFRQIYIVSHNETLKDYFPHLLEVQNTADGSIALWR